MFKLILCVILTAISWPLSMAGALIVVFCLSLDGTMGQSDFPCGTPRAQYYWWKVHMSDFFGLTTWIKEELK